MSKSSPVVRRQDRAAADPAPMAGLVPQFAPGAGARR